MLSFLRAQSPPRTKTSHLHTLHLENGRSKVSFSSATDLASKDTTILFTLPPCEPGPNPRDNSFLIPVIHFHPNQSETFRITYGTCVITCDGKKHICPAGESFTVKQYEYHSFANASSTEEMTLEASYDPPDRKREERFFRNLCGYLEDCSDKGKAMGTGASFPQIVAFAWEADIIACGPFAALGLPRFIGVPLSFALNWFLGVLVAQWLLGYKSSYPEYFNEKEE